MPYRYRVVEMAGEFRVAAVGSLGGTLLGFRGPYVRCPERLKTYINEEKIDILEAPYCEAMTQHGDKACNDCGKRDG